jgi:hypothetical protein
MANISRPQMLEGQSTHRPPLFTGSDYGYWKTRLTLYFKAQDYHVWSHCKWPSYSHKNYGMSNHSKIRK